MTTRGKRPPISIEDEAKEIVAAAAVTNAKPERVLLMTEFVDRVYFPHAKEYKRPSTYKGYSDIWRNHVKGRCSGVWLKDVRTCDIQEWLDQIAKPGTLGRNSLKHIKTFLSAVFKLAKQQGYYRAENPVRPQRPRRLQRLSKRMPTIWTRFSRCSPSCRNPQRPFSQWLRSLACGEASYRD